MMKVMVSFLADVRSSVCSLTLVEATWLIMFSLFVGGYLEVMVLDLVIDRRANRVCRF